MRLLKRRAVGTNVHRSGWPRVMQALGLVASDSGVLLDDFADACFTYKPMDQPYREPWVGIFHHPVHIDSPLASDRSHALRMVESHRYWPESRMHLRGAIVFCEEAAGELRSWLRIPTLNIRHPTEHDVPRWNAAMAFAERRLIQVGFNLRNTRLIFQIAPAGWQRLHLSGNYRRHQVRNDELARLLLRPEIRPSEVEVVRRVDNAMYDQLLTKSVVITELYGAAANNLVVECLARGTPIVVNRLPAVEEYLGSDYPLFYSKLTDIEELLTDESLLSAHHHLVRRSTGVPSFWEFAQHAAGFVDSVGVRGK